MARVAEGSNIEKTPTRPEQAAQSVQVRATGTKEVRHCRTYGREPGGRNS